MLTTVAADSAIFRIDHARRDHDGVDDRDRRCSDGQVCGPAPPRRCRSEPRSALDAMFGAVAADRVSVSQDGLRIVGISSNGGEAS